MANTYVKAALLTAALTLLAFFFIGQLDAMRAAELQKGVDELMMESDSERVMFLYSQVLGNGSSELCSYATASADAKSSQAYSLLQKINLYEKSNVLNSEYDRIRNRYYLSNAALYLNLRASEKYCGGKQLDTMIFFYRISPDCPECRAQGGVLDGLRAKEPGLKIFAFPIDSDLPVVKALMSRHNVTSAPTLVVRDTTLPPGLKNEEELWPYIGMAGNQG